MLLLIVLLSSAIMAMAADSPKSAATPLTKPAVKEAPIQETVALKMENLALRLQLLQAEAEKLQQERTRLAEAACTSVNIAPVRCSLDLQRKMVTEMPEKK